MEAEKQAPAVSCFFPKSPVAALCYAFLRCPGLLRFCWTGISEGLFLKSREIFQRHIFYAAQHRRPLLHNSEIQPA